MKALSPEHATDDERAFVRSRLLGTSTSASQKRQRLASAVGRAVTLPDIEGAVVVRLREAGHREQANELVSARAFGAVLDRARDAVANLTRAVEPGRGGVKLATLGSDSTLRKSIRDLRSAATSFVEKANTAAVTEATSRSFADAVVAFAHLQRTKTFPPQAQEVAQWPVHHEGKTLLERIYWRCLENILVTRYLGSLPTMTRTRSVHFSV